MNDDVRHGTRWGLVALVLAPTTAVLAVLGSAVSTGALALEFVTQSGTVDLRTSGLRAEEFGVAVVAVRTADPAGGTRPVPSARIGLGAARINGLCLAHELSLLGKPFTLLIEGGDDDASTFEIGVDGLVLDVRDVRAAIGVGGEVQVNKDGGDVTVPAVGGPLDGRAASFGLQGATARLGDIDATVRDVVIPDLLDAPDFRITVVPGARACPDPPAER